MNPTNATPFFVLCCDKDPRKHHVQPLQLLRPRQTRIPRKSSRQILLLPFLRRLLRSLPAFHRLIQYRKQRADHLRIVVRTRIRKCRPRHRLQPFASAFTINIASFRSMSTLTRTRVSIDSPSCKEYAACPHPMIIGCGFVLSRRNVFSR